MMTIDNEIFFRMSMKKMPMEIQNYILSFHGHSISTTLEEDIIDYMNTFTYTFGLCHYISLSEEEEDDDLYIRTFVLDFFQNELFRFMNECVPTMYGFVPPFYEKWKRLFGLDTDQKVDEFIFQLEAWEISRQVRIMFGILTCLERQEFIAFLYQQHDILHTI